MEHDQFICDFGLAHSMNSPTTRAVKILTSITRDDDLYDKWMGRTLKCHIASRNSA